jgi:DNA polymerase-4
VQRRAVLHVDADAFFVSCHVAEDPALSGLPVAVAGDPGARHGIVLSASYAARRFGVRTAMPLSQARRLCPALRLIAPDGALYRRYSARLRRVFDRFSPVVEPFSIDEAWLDMSGGLGPYGGDARTAAQALRRAVRDATRLPCSVGVSTNKMLAKQATQLAKPDGVATLWPQEVPDRLWPRPVDDLFGCGPSTAGRLRSMGVRTVGDLARAPDAVLAPLGSQGAVLRRRARGEDRSPVTPPRPGEAKSMGAETTLAFDVSRVEEAEPYLLALAEQVSARLRAHAVSARRLELRYRTADFVDHSRRGRLPDPAADGATLYRTARRLFAERPDPGPVRLLGIAAAALSSEDDPAQLSLWPNGRERQRRLDRAVDRIRRAYGDDAIMPARLLGGPTVRRAGSSFDRPWRDPEGEPEEPES